MRWGRSRPSNVSFLFACSSWTMVSVFSTNFFYKPRFFFACYDLIIDLWLLHTFTLDNWYHSLVGHAAITRLKEEKVRCMGMQDPPVTEEFMPLRTNSGPLKESCDKKNWMSSAQLWSTETKSVILNLPFWPRNFFWSKTTSILLYENIFYLFIYFWQWQRCEEEDRSVPENPIQTREHKNRSGGALFNGNSKEVSKVPSFSLMTPMPELNRSNSKSGCGGSSLLMGHAERHGQPRAQIQPQHLQQNPRKQRRCWSPELHRRFVDALRQLGGAQGRLHS